MAEERADSPAGPARPTIPAAAGSDDNADGWTTCWDDKTQAYYYWNTRTGKVTWENPLLPSSSSLLAKDDTAAAAAVAAVGNTPAATSSVGDQFTPAARGLRQMQHYFDVDAYQEQVNERLRRRKLPGDDNDDGDGDDEHNTAKSSKRRLTKQDVRRFKAQREQKKKAKLLEKFAD
ncbi:hypothetical protein RI367_000781 [Sorochytrium milnesiophthora]